MKGGLKDTRGYEGTQSKSTLARGYIPRNTRQAQTLSEKAWQL